MMATLSRFKQNIQKVNDGTWITLGEEFGGIEIQTKGFTDKYNDAREARIRKAARKFFGDTTKVPTADMRKIIVDTLVEFCLMDVKNLQDETGKDVPFETFKELLYEPEYSDLYLALISAAATVTNEREADVIETKKNSVTPSVSP